MGPPPAEEPCEFCEQVKAEGVYCQPPKLSHNGKVVLAVGGLMTTILYGLTTPFVLPGFRKICLPFVPASKEQIRNVIHCLQGRTGSCIDLGSGDGRIIFELAKSTQNRKAGLQGLQSYEGVEMNSVLVGYSKFQRMRKGFDKNYVNFFKGDIMKLDLHRYDNVVVFGVESLMEALEVKLEKEFKPNGQVIACRFPFPNIDADHEFGEGIDKVWIYKNHSVETSV